MYNRREGGKSLPEVSQDGAPSTSEDRQVAVPEAPLAAREEKANRGTGVYPANPTTDNAWEAEEECERPAVRQGLGTLLPPSPASS